MIGDDHVVAEARADWDLDLDVVRFLLALLRQELFVALNARLRFRLACFGRRLDPLELARELTLARRFLLLLVGEPLALLLEPRRVVALPRNAGAAIELEDPA